MTTSKKTPKAAKKITTINAGGGIMVDIVEKAPKAAPKTAAKENPYREGGCYWAIVHILAKMGADRCHDFAAFATRVKADWSGYKAFAKKEARNEATAKDAEGKLLTNVRVLQRKDYGEPLHLQGRCIDMGYEGSQLWVMLNSRSKTPQTPGRAPKAEAPKAAVKKTASKATPVKGKAQNGKAKAPKAVEKPPILSGADAVKFLAKK